MWKLFALFRDPTRCLKAGDAARDRRDFGMAAKYYRRYLWRRPNDGPLWVQYGHALKEIGRRAEASDAYQRACSLMPFDAELRLQIGHLNKISGQLRAAIASYRHALELDPTLRAAQQELDRLQSVGDRDLIEAWRKKVDIALSDAARNIVTLEQRIASLEAKQLAEDIANEPPAI